MKGEGSREVRGADGRKDKRGGGRTGWGRKGKGKGEKEGWRRRGEWGKDEEGRGG